MNAASKLLKSTSAACLAAVIMSALTGAARAQSTGDYSASSDSFKYAFSVLSAGGFDAASSSLLPTAGQWAKLSEKEKLANVTGLVEVVRATASSYVPLSKSSNVGNVDVAAATMAFSNGSLIMGQSALAYYAVHTPGQTVYSYREGDSRDLSPPKIVYSLKDEYAKFSDAFKNPLLESIKTKLTSDENAFANQTQDLATTIRAIGEAENLIKSSNCNGAANNACSALVTRLNKLNKDLTTQISDYRALITGIKADTSASYKAFYNPTTLPKRFPGAYATWNGGKIVPIRSDLPVLAALTSNRATPQALLAASKTAKKQGRSSLPVAAKALQTVKAWPVTKVFVKPVSAVVVPKVAHK